MTGTRRWMLVVACALLGFPVGMRGQEEGPASGGAPAQAAPETRQNEGGVETLHASTHMVVLDVVVTDRKGHTVLGLSQDDFHLFEDGRPQAVKFFEEHAPVDPALVAKQKAEFAARLPVNTFTSYETFTGDPVTVLLVNKLTSLPFYDIDALRQQIMGVIDGARPEAPFVIYELDTKLRLVQPVTSNRGLLRAAVKQMWQQPYFGQPPAALGVDTGKQVLNLNGAVVLARKKVFTAAMDQIGASFGPAMGRKTLFMFTGGLRCTLSSAVGCEDVTPDLVEYLCGVMDKLEQARISLYRDYPAGPIYGLGCKGAPSNLRDVYDTNAHYYTLYYTPGNGDWNGKYRKFKVTTDDGKLRLSYREGYYGRQENTQAGHGVKVAETVPPDLVAGKVAAATGEAANAQADEAERPPDDATNPMPVIFTVKVEPAAAPGTGPQAVPPSPGDAESEADRTSGYRDYTLHFFVQTAGLRLVRELKAGEDPGQAPYVARLMIAAVSYVHGYATDARTIEVAANFAGRDDPRIANGAITASLTVQVPEKGPRLLHITVRDVFSGQFVRMDIPVEKVVLPAQ
jgi:VWFA-related protein